jgi:nucleoid-associated protein YgaU
MKRISFLLVAALLFGATFSRADDAAVEERLNKLSGQIEDLLAAAAKQDKRLSAMAKELESVREQAAKPSGNFASPEELRKLAEKLQEIDQKRVADNERIVKEIEKLGKAPSGGTVGGRKPPRTSPPVDDPPKGGSTAGGGADKGFEYVIASGDSLSTIAQAYREKGVKVTSEQILKANPGLNEKSLKVGQTIFIPSPKP